MPFYLTLTGVPHWECWTGATSFIGDDIGGLYGVHVTVI